MVAKTAGYQQVDLALDEFVQAGGLQHAQADFRMRCAKFCQCQAAQVEARMQAELELYRACGPQFRGRGADATKAARYLRQEGLAGRCQDELLMQPLEQAHAEARLQGLHLLPNGGGRHMQLMRGQLETQMTRRGFESAQRVEWWEGVGHGRPVCHR